MSRARHYLVLGLDPGIASCGFALLDMTDHRILEMGAHLFDAPQEDKTKVSLATSRRMARSTRRNTLRTRMRLKHCLQLLKDAGLVPADAQKGWLQSQKGDKPVLKLRARGLNMLLTDRQLAQVLYSICSHRGYIPHGEGRAGQTDDAEGRKVLNAIKKNRMSLEEGHYRTVGEMFNAVGKYRNSSGEYENCVLNSQLQDEVRTILAAQRDLGNPKATQQLADDYIQCLTWEKPALEHDQRVYDLVGACSYFPDEKRAADADVTSQLCRAYERLKHLVIVSPDATERTLNQEQVNGYLKVLFSPTPLPRNKDCKVTYQRIRQDLELSALDRFKGIDQDAEKSAEVFAPRAWRSMRNSDVDPELLQRMLEDRTLGDAVCEALTYSSSEASLAEQLDGLDLTEDEAASLFGVPFGSKVFSGYGNRSLKALNLLVDAFEDEDVHTLAQAEDACGLLSLRLSDRGVRGTLLPPYSTYDPTCNNPVVLRALARMRRIVNAIIRIYGVPDEIHIELGRELKQSKREKDLVTKRNRANEAANKRYAKQASEVLGIDPDQVPGRVIRKLSMWDDQDGRDAYTGQPIPIEQLIRDDRCCEIDHVLPYSRTYDDSRANKVLVFAKSNQDKRERTPYEWMTSGEPGAPDWTEYQARVLSSVKSHRKRNNLLNKCLDSDAQAQFIARNLNDDRYMSRAVKNYLEDCLAFPEDGRKKHVSAVAGGATGNLRWVWGLNYGGNNSKDRADDRHHAVDAAVIAACSDATVKKVAEARALGRNTFRQVKTDRLSQTQPWPSFAIEVDTRRNSVVPTRMVSHGVTGRLFEDTLYHLEGFTNDKGRYPLVRAGERTVKKGNVVLREDGSAKLVDGMAFLRLWLDPDAKGRAGKKGKWYAEPVYYADMAAIQDGSYVPRACKIHVARVNWEPVPDSAMRLEPIVLFSGDVVTIDSYIGRYKSFSISPCRLIFESLTGADVQGSVFPCTPGGWSAETHIATLQEDCLGRCYNCLCIDPSTDTFAYLG